MSFRGDIWLCLICAVSCGGCGPKIAIHPEEAEAIVRIEQLGGTVEIDPLHTEHRVHKVYLQQSRVQDADLVVLKSFPNLKNVFLGKTAITNAGLAQVSELTNLITLSLNSTQITDEGLKSLSQLKKLKTINLQETEVTAAGANQLKRTLPNLTIAR